LYFLVYKYNYVIRLRRGRKVSGRSTRAVTPSSCREVTIESFSCPSPPMSTRRSGRSLRMAGRASAKCWTPFSREDPFILGRAVARTRLMVRMTFWRVILQFTGNSRIRFALMTQGDNLRTLMKILSCRAGMSQLFQTIKVLIR
jgi:hypothetical protein